MCVQLFTTFKLAVLKLNFGKIESSNNLNAVYYITLLFALLCTACRGRIGGIGGADSLSMLPDKLKTELALFVNLNTLKKVPSSILHRSTRFACNLCQI